MRRTIKPVLIHSKCGMPLTVGESRDSYLRLGHLLGFFCVECKDEKGFPLEVLLEEEMETFDLMKGLYD